MPCAAAHCNSHGTGAASCAGHRAACPSNQELSTAQLPTTGNNRFAQYGKVTAAHINELKNKVDTEVRRVNEWLSANPTRAAGPIIGRRLDTNSTPNLSPGDKIKASEYNSVAESINDIAGVRFPISGNLNSITSYTTNRTNFAAEDLESVGDKIVFSGDWAELANKYNMVRTDCICNADCACNAVCACHNDCGCNYGGSGGVSFLVQFTEIIDSGPPGEI